MESFESSIDELEHHGNFSYVICPPFFFLFLVSRALAYEILLFILNKMLTLLFTCELVMRADCVHVPSLQYTIFVASRFSESTSSHTHRRYPFDEVYLVFIKSHEHLTARCMHAYRSITC